MPYVVYASGDFYARYNRLQPALAAARDLSEFHPDAVALCYYHRADEQCLPRRLRPDGDPAIVILDGLT